MINDKNTIKDWLLPKLEAKNMSVEQFASASGISRASVYFYLTDKTRPSTPTMKRMCDVLEVPFEEGLSQYTHKIVGRPKGYR